MEEKTQTAPKRLKIAFLSVNDPKDRRSWSGTTYYIADTLQRNVGDVDFLGPMTVPRWLDKMLRGIAKANRILFKKEYAVKYSFLMSWYAARFFKKKINGRQYDLMVAPAASTELARLKTNSPVVYISDTTFNLIQNYYSWDFNNILPVSIKEGNKLEKRSLQKSSHVILSSVWAVNSALEYYNIPSDKVSMVPLGANMDHVPDASVIYKKFDQPVLTLLFLAVEWERKGGAIALDTFYALKKMNRPVRLIICGCRPPFNIEDPDVQVVPFLNKNDPADHQRFIDILSTIHFLVLPTRADCSLLVACEASAYGVPSISTATGGVPDIVKDGINGYCLPYEARADRYAALIEEIYSDQERYKRLVHSSRKRFEDVLNWDKWSESFRAIYDNKIRKQ